MTSCTCPPSYERGFPNTSFITQSGMLDDPSWRSRYPGVDGSLQRIPLGLLDHITIGSLTTEQQAQQARFEATFQLGATLPTTLDLQIALDSTVVELGAAASNPPLLAALRAKGIPYPWARVYWPTVVGGRELRERIASRTPRPPGPRSYSSAPAVGGCPC